MSRIEGVVAWALLVLALGALLAMAFDVLLLHNYEAVAFHGMAALFLTLVFSAYAFLALRR